MPIVIDPKRLHDVKIGDVTFRVKAMTGREILALSGDLATMDNNPDAIYSVLHKCLKKWKGVVAANGKEVPCTPENIDALPVEVSAQVFEKITSISGLQGQEGN